MSGISLLTLMTLGVCFCLNIGSAVEVAAPSDPNSFPTASGSFSSDKVVVELISQMPQTLQMIVMPKTSNTDDQYRNYLQVVPDRISLWNSYVLIEDVILSNLPTVFNTSQYGSFEETDAATGYFNFTLPPTAYFSNLRFESFVLLEIPDKSTNLPTDSDLNLEEDDVIVWKIPPLISSPFWSLFWSLKPKKAAHFLWDHLPRRLSLHSHSRPPSEL